jgi:rRNA processing protein Krr1/Pno1
MATASLDAITETLSPPPSRPAGGITLSLPHSATIPITDKIALLDCIEDHDMVLHNKQVLNRIQRKICGKNEIIRSQVSRMCQEIFVNPVPVEVLCRCD